jgi:DNA-binding response OmpR family regulator
MSYILVVEDHRDIAEGLQANLEIEGHEVELARDGRHAVMAVKRRAPDLVILDLGLPGLDGFGVLQAIREANCWCPVLILSARGAEADKLQGFRLGADDYVTKPFGTMELLARVNAQLRRAAVAAPPEPAKDRSANTAATAPRDAAEIEQLLAQRFELTPRQASVARLVADGLTNEEIAQVLGISRFTARNHVEQVLEKLDVSSRTRVAALVHGGGLSTTGS